ncbi:peptide/nickel transport system ATP-binding protein [Actinacidiphila alni]|uniref:Peptide/nickel transport system ATP-binding protein n=1 Tax=Actinacidiphila alni TaxID=380248 RepID=A0A1I1XEP4_9ACTN|nr:ABC transporter ATP-binding protein [Actinacidiphila alni]SFE05641.1 peptide/nickel transport system ATP-binding protein [Actinacidiphila alni]
MSEPLLTVSDLSVGYAGSGTRAVSDVGFRVAAGSSLGVIGESGSGKTTLLYGMARLLPASATVESGSVRLDGVDLLTLPAPELRDLRWRDIAIVFQGAMHALNPVIRVGSLLREVLRHRLDVRSRQEADRRITDMLDMVSVPSRVLTAYPHELSGGMRQRVMLAMSLLGRPRLLLVDEPTTSLDVIVQAEILDRLRELQRELRFAMVFVSHDLGVVAEYCDDVAVMLDGRIVESGRGADVLRSPVHPYTRRLVESYPSVDRPPQPLPPRTGAPDGAASVDSVASAAVARTGRDSGAVTVKSASAADVLPPPVLELRAASRSFRARGGTPWRRRRTDAVRDVDIEVRAGSILAIVGASGAGKSTVGRLLAMTDRPTGGELRSDGRPVRALGRADRAVLRRRVQVVHQDPFEALDPRFTVERSVAEGLGPSGPPGARRRELVAAALEHVELDPGRFLTRTPDRLSGGQRQRVALARALVARPDVIVADEPVSALDVSIRLSVLRLLARARDEYGTAVVLITHDLGTVRAVVDEIIVMSDGRVVERGATATVLDRPRHDYTKALIAAAPKLPRGGATPAG